jgi:hypothetical protein
MTAAPRSEQMDRARRQQLPQPPAPFCPYGHARRAVLSTRLGRPPPALTPPQARPVGRSRQPAPAPRTGPSRETQEEAARPAPAPVIGTRRNALLSVAIHKEALVQRSAAGRRGSWSLNMDQISSSACRIGGLCPIALGNVRCSLTGAHPTHPWTTVCSWRHLQDRIHATANG